MPSLMGNLKSLSKWRTRLLSYFLILIVGVMLVTVLWQIFTRLVLRAPAVWTEESSTYMLVWCGIIGAAYAYGQKAHIGMEYFSQKLSPRSKKILEIIISVLVGFFAFKVMLVGGMNFVRNAFVNHQTSPTMGIPVGYFYLCLPIGAFFIFTYAAEFILDDILFLIDREEK